MAHFQVVVAGGGSAGLTVAAQLLNKPNAPEVAIIDPANKHYYQPMWTLIGAGVFPREESEKKSSRLHSCWCYLGKAIYFGFRS